MKVSAVIIGGGITGVSTALYAAQRADPLHPVVLLEREDLAAGSSGRSGGILRTYYAEPQLAGIARDSLRVYRTLLARTGRRIGFRQSGVLSLACDAGAEELRRNVLMMQNLAIDVRILEDKEITQLWPGLRVQPGTIAAFEPDAGSVNPVETIVTMAALAREAGAVIRAGAGVEEILVEGGRVVGVRTSGGDYTTECVLVAAGPWSKALLDAIGCSIPLTCVASEQQFIGMPGGRVDVEEDTADELEEPDPLDVESRFGGPTTQLDPHPILFDYERGFYARCEIRRGRCRVGAISAEKERVLKDPDRLDELAVSKEFSRWAREGLVERVPQYESLDDSGTELGWYTMTPDTQPVLGPVPQVEGLFVATGFSGHGFKLGPSIGEGMAQMMAGQPVSAFDPEFFAPERFARS